MHMILILGLRKKFKMNKKKDKKLLLKIKIQNLLQLVAWLEITAVELGLYITEPCATTS